MLPILQRFPQFLMQILPVLLGSFLLSLGLTRLLIFLLPKLGMIDIPDTRRIHDHPIPRGGGFAIFVSYTCVACLFMSFANVSTESHNMFYFGLLPLGILIPAGLIDDRWGMKARWKLLFQILTAILAWQLGFRWEDALGFTFPAWGSCVMTVLWIVTMINAFNMIDGVDGLAAGIACISASCMLFVCLFQNSTQGAFLLLIFLGSLVGFLRYNWNPAKIFMGDTGSMFLGYILALSSLSLNAHTFILGSIGIPLLACGIPILDIMLAVWRRLLGSQQNPKYGLFQRLGSADKYHLHHRLLEYYRNNQRKTVLTLYILNFIIGLGAIICCCQPSHYFLLASLIILATFSLILQRLATIELWLSAENVYGHLHSVRTGLILSHVLNPFFDLLSIFLAFYLMTQGTNSCRLEYLTPYIVIVMLVLLFSQNYRTFWNLSVTDDYFRLIFNLSLGFFISWLSRFWFAHNLSCYEVLGSWGCSIALILAERLSIYYFRNHLIRLRTLHRSGGVPPAKRVILYGITPLTRFYRNLYMNDITHAAQQSLLGLVSEVARFRNSFCYGLKVLGVPDDLPQILQKYHFTHIVITCDMTKENEEKLYQFCQKNHISCGKLCMQELPVIMNNTTPPDESLEGTPPPTHTSRTFLFFSAMHSKN